MSALIFDIETVGESWDALDGTSQASLSRWIERESRDEGAYESALEDLKQGLGFSPLTGEIVALGVLDDGGEKGAVYYQDPTGKEALLSEGAYKYEPMTERAILGKFWSDIAPRYDTFVSFNGRGFDVPFMMVRSAIHGIRPSKNLMANRYTNYQPGNAKHVDLLDQLSFYGALRRKGSLHLWCRAFGIGSPKAGGVSGDDVAGLYAAGKGLDIAKYNAGDLEATLALYRKFEEFLSF